MSAMATLHDLVTDLESEGHRLAGRFRVAVKTLAGGAEKDAASVETELVSEGHDIEAAIAPALATLKADLTAAFDATAANLVARVTAAASTPGTPPGPAQADTAQN